MKIVGLPGAVLVGCIMLLCGCSGYQLASHSHNMIVEQTSPKIFTINFCAKSSMKQDEILNAALAQAAHTAIGNGYQYFFVVEKKDNSTECIQNPGVKVMQTGTMTNSANTGPSAAYNSPHFVRPNIMIKVQCFAKDEQMPKDVIDAQKFLDAQNQSVKN